MTGQPPDVYLLADPPPIVLRAIANGLWASLKRDRWETYRQTRDLGDNGSNPPFRSIGTANIPNSPRKDDQELIYEERYIRCEVNAGEWPGAEYLMAELTKTRYDQARSVMTINEVADLETAYRYASWTPYRLATNRHGKRVLRRQGEDPHMTFAAAAALQTIAAHAAIGVADQAEVDEYKRAFGERIHLAGVDAVWRASLGVPNNGAIECIW